jgi:hypothetical protein
MTWTKPQGVSDTLIAGGSTTVNNVYGSATVVDNLLIAVVHWVNATTCTGVTDTEGNSWTSTPRVQVGALNNFVQVWYAFAGTTGTPTVTATFSGSSIYRGVALDEFSEDGGLPTFDAQAGQYQASPGTGTDAVTSGNLTVAENGSLLFGFAGVDEASDFLSAGTGFTLTGSNLLLDATTVLRGEWDTVNSGTDAATFTISSAAGTITLGLAFSPFDSTVNITATTDALVLAEHQVTVGITGAVNITATTDALVLAESPASVGITIHGSSDALVLTEYPVTVDLGGSVNITATTDALVLSENVVTVFIATPVNITATTDALVLSENVVTVFIATPVNIIATTDALVLSENAVTVSIITAATSLTVSAITGGASLTSLSYVVFDASDIGSASIIKQANDETTDVNGDLVIDLTGLGVVVGTKITVIITNYTTAPEVTDKGAVCFGIAA